MKLSAIYWRNGGKNYPNTLVVVFAGIIYIFLQQLAMNYVHICTSWFLLCGLWLGIHYMLGVDLQSFKTITRPSTSSLDSQESGVDTMTFRAVFVTVPSIEIAKSLASGLVSKKLAACVNIIPQITSVYEWEGKVNEDSELLLMIKTQSHLFDELSTYVKENHPYDVPEVIGLPIEQGTTSYLDWIKSVTKQS